MRKLQRAGFARALQVAGVAAMVMQVAAGAEPALSDGVLGLRWGETTAAIRAKFPDAKVVPEAARVGVVDQNGILGVRSQMGGIFILTLDTSGGLSSVSFQAAPEDVPRLLSALRQALGAARSLEQKSLFGTFTHVYEWSTPAVSARINYSTKESGEAAAAVGVTSAEVHRGPLAGSLIDAMTAPVRTNDPEQRE
jgi:hypothetical protein